MLEEHHSLDLSFGDTFVVSERSGGLPADSLDANVKITDVFLRCDTT